MPDKPKPTAPTDFWAGTTAPPPGAASTPAPESGGNEDYKLWQGGESAEQPSTFQTLKNNFNAGTQHAAPPTGMMDMLSPKRALQNFGASAGDAIRGTYHMFDEKPKMSLDQQYDEAGKQVENFAKDPIAAYVNAAGQNAPAFLAGGLTHGAVEALPSRTRAVSALNSIEQQGANTPVDMIRTPEALADYQQHHLKPGGMTKLPLTRLGERIDEGPMNFPEARDYYSKVSTATRAPGFLGRAFEGPEQPQFRAASGPVRMALHSDLERAADTFGRGEDYQNALKEYAQNAKLRSMGKKAAIAGAGAAAGSMGLGKLHGMASSVLR